MKAFFWGVFQEEDEVEFLDRGSNAKEQILRDVCLGTPSMKGTSSMKEQGMNVVAACEVSIGTQETDRHPRNEISSFSLFSMFLAEEVDWVLLL